MAAGLGAMVGWQVAVILVGVLAVIYGLLFIDVDDPGGARK